jgi:N-acetylmuramoyl-L-alanine amidase
MVDPRTGEEFIKCYEFGMLAVAIWLEARGEPFEGQCAVGEVILKRMEHPSWPDTLGGVILQHMQFSCFNERIDIPKPQDGGWASFTQCCEAAAAALGGTDHAKGATHYLNIEATRAGRPKGDLPAWFHGSQVTAVIGRHTFLLRND